MSHEPPYEEEEAARLARALERADRPPESSIDDALDAADVVRLLRAPTLSEARRDAVLADAQARIARARARARRRLTWLGAGAGAIALAAAALLMVRTRDAPAARHASAPARSAEAHHEAPHEISGEPPIGAAAAPERARALDRAQRAWLGAPTEAASAELASALAAYRTEFLGALERRHGR